MKYYIIDFLYNIIYLIILKLQESNIFFKYKIYNNKKKNYMNFNKIYIYIYIYI